MNYKIILATFFWTLLSPAVSAHEQSRSFLKITVADSLIKARWDLSLYDLELLVGLDIDQDGKVTWGEVKSRREEIFTEAFASLTAKSLDQNCKFEQQDMATARHTDGIYTAILFEIQCPVAPLEDLELTYTFLKDIDPAHRGLLDLNLNSRHFTHVFSAEKRDFLAAADAPVPNPLPIFFREGVHHAIRTNI